MAAYLNDPIDLGILGVNGASIVVTANHPTAGIVTVYDPSSGGWQPGWGGTISGTGDGAIAFSITTIPGNTAFGTWIMTVSAAAYGGALGGGTWSFIIAPTFSIDTGYQSTLNTVDIEFSTEPKHLDPADPTDGINLDNYTVTGPVSPFAERLLQVVTYEGDNTLRLWFDGPLVTGESYTITLSNIESIAGVALSGTPSFSFVAFGASSVPVPLERQPAEQWDIRNPQATADAPQGAALGTFVIDDDGDLGVETRRSYLRKRVFRRLTTRKGSNVLLPDYGLDYEAKGLQTPARMRRLQQDTETQIRQEPGVLGVRASVAQDTLAPGIVVLTVRVRDEFGDYTEHLPIGGGE